MIQIAISEYLAEIDQLIEDQRFVESIAHCRHILQQHPRHIDTYRMLGKALLEQKNFHDAADVFQRVLSADPEDFISHVGMSIINKEDTLIPQAVWHMERAHEMDPYNQVIREELLELYQNRDKRLPLGLPLSRSALARLYYRGEMYQMAATELRQLIAEDDSRMDLRTLLAETLWHAGQRVDAVDVCLEILDRLPNSVKANAILAEVWLTTGRGDEANEFLNALGRLSLPDHETIGNSILVNTVYHTDGAPELPQQQMVNYLDYVPESAQEAEDFVPQWMGELDLISEDGPADPDAAVVDDIPTPLPLTDVPDWFDDLDNEPADSTIRADDAASLDSTGSLDWLRDVAVSRSDRTTQPEEPQMDIVDEVMASSPTEDIPDWLGGILDDQEGDSLLNSLIQEDSRELPTSESGPDISGADSALDYESEVVEELNWLHDEFEEESAEASAEEDNFTWLDNPSNPVLDVPQASVADESDFDWFEEEVDIAAAIDQNSDSEALIPASKDSNVDSFDDLDWLDDQSDGAPPRAETPAVIAADDFNWLDQELAADEDEANLIEDVPEDQADEFTMSAEIDDFMSQSESSLTIDTMEQSIMADNLPDVDVVLAASGSEEQHMDLHDNPDNEEEEFPTESESSSSTQPANDDALDWLQDLVDSDPTNTGVLRTGDGDQPLPDWLTQDMGQGSMPKDLPDWLAEDALASGSDLSATVTDHEMVIPDVDRGTSELNQAALTGSSPDANKGPTSEIFAEGEMQEDLSWLDAMSPVDEPPTLSWADSEVNNTPTDEPETPVSAQLVIPPELIEDDSADEPTDSQDETVMMTKDEVAEMRAAIKEPDSDEFAFLEETPSEAEIAMDWISELDEPNEAPTTEVIQSDDPFLPITDEAEDAMSWLEDLSASGDLNAGVTNSDDVDAIQASVIGEEPPSSGSGNLTWLDELSQPVLDVDAPDSTLNVSEDVGSVAASGDTVSSKDLDSAEVMAWLDDLAEIPESEAEGTITESNLLPDLLGSDIAMPVADNEPVVEDDSDAMAWLDELASELSDEDGPETTIDEAPVVAELPQEMAEAAAFDIDSSISGLDSAVDTVEESIPDFSEPMGSVEASDDGDDAMSWLEDLISDESDVAESDIFDTAAVVEDTLDMGALAEAADEVAAVELPEAETHQVVVDGQVVPDLDIEPTDDIFSDEEAMSWMNELLNEESGTADSELLETTAEIPEIPEVELPEAELPELDAPEVVTHQVVIDGQVIPDLDMEPTDDIFSDEEAMSWMNELINEETVIADPVAEVELPVAETPAVMAELDVDSAEDLIDDDLFDELLTESKPMEIPADALEFTPEIEAEVAELIAADPAGAPDNIITEATDSALEDFAEELNSQSEPELSVPEVEAPEVEAPVVETHQVMVDGQVVPDLDIEPTEDPVSEADAMAWLDEFISEVDQSPVDDATPEVMPSAREINTAVAAPIVPDRPVNEEAVVEAEADDGLAALAFLEELAMTGNLDEVVAEDPSDAVLDMTEDSAADSPPEQIVTRAMPTEPEMSLAELVDDIPEDPDEAMDWIRSMADEEPEAEVDEMDMSWLDDLSSEDGEEVPELEFSAEEIADVAEPVSELPGVLDELVEAESPEIDVAETEVEILAEDIPEVVTHQVVIDGQVIPDLDMEPTDDIFSDDEAMSWMNELLSESGLDSGEAVTLETPAEESVEMELPEAVVDDLPEMIDEALAEIESEVAEIAPEPIAIADLPSASESPGDTESDLEIVESEPDIPVDEAVVLEEEPPDLMNSQVEGALPDWLLDDDDAAPDSIGWMEAIGDSSVTDWLTAEEETLSSTFEAVDANSLAVPGTGPLDERKLPRRGGTGPLDESKLTPKGTGPLPTLPEADAVPEPLVEASPPADMDTERLEVARASVVDRNYDKAASDYGELLQAGKGLDVLIGDLEKAQTSTRNPLLIRMLGDVYMRDGQLQNALDRYRQALDLM